MLSDEEPLVEGKDFYYDENGLLVLTKEFLLKKGYCCGNRCRNCPYGNAPTDDE